MIKHFYFGAISPDELNEYGPDYTPFVVEGVACDFQLRVDLQDGYAQLTDSIGRMVPIDKQHYAELVSALTIAQDLQDDMDDMALITDFVIVQE